MAKPDAPQNEPQNDPQDDTTFDTTAGDSTADETTQLEQTVPSDTQQFNDDTSDATRAIGVDEPTGRDLFGNPVVGRADDQPFTVAAHGSDVRADEPALPARPTGPHAPAIVLGLVCLAVAGIILAQELGDLTPDWGDIGPFGIIVTGAVLVLFGLVGLLTSRRGGNTT